MRRNTPFSYVCHRCRRCCRHKIIRLNPYEVARLARNRGMETTDFLGRYTTAGGTVLAAREDGTCVFLTPGGCGVYPDRPLVCRLYPLGRRIKDGRETFSRAAPDPGCEGVAGREGTVGGYLEEQGARACIEVVDRYLLLAGRMIAVLQARIEMEPAAADPVRRTCAAPSGAGIPVPDRLDMDPVVREYCRKKGIPIPSDVAAGMALHIEAIEEWLDMLGKEKPHGEGKEGRRRRQVPGG